MSITSPAIPVLETISGFAHRYDAWLLDIWGVLHNGVEPFAAAVTACQTFRSRGGSVVLVSNSPRPRDGVATQLAEIGVASDSYDGICSSGDVTRQLVSAYAGRAIYHIGPERDLPMFGGLPVTFGPAREAAAIVCSGLRDDEAETVADYAALLAELHALGLPMICANPDLVCERGCRIIPCAGSLAQAYEKIGGVVVYAGKPHMPIYDLAMAFITAQRGAALPRHRVLAIGDGVRTDIAGAAALGVDAVFIASGVHMADARGAGLTPEAVAQAFAGVKIRPIAALDALVW